jgi:uncharacterized protein (DUF488 family)
LEILYTIGHSNHSLEELLAMLQQHGVNCVVDVRSVAASKYTPQFNEDVLQRFLRNNGLQYLHFGEEFGARRTDCLVDGQVNFEQAVKTEAFQRGVMRLKNGMQKGFRIALMCSEAEPLECHRFSLVARYFYDLGLDVQHILKNSKLASHLFLEEQMISGFLHSSKYHVSEVDELFGLYTADDQRRDAYRQKNREIGYRPTDNVEE